MRETPNNNNLVPTIFGKKYMVLLATVYNVPYFFFTGVDAITSWMCADARYTYKPLVLRLLNENVKINKQNRLEDASMDNFFVLNRQKKGEP